MRYEVGMEDPTLEEPDPRCMFKMPREEGGVWYCTWHKGHEHPQHVAGGGDKVLAVAEVTEDLHITYKVGDPDPTPAGSAYCNFEIGNGYCTWAPDHAHPQHVAGDGYLVVDVCDRE